MALSVTLDWVGDVPATLQRSLGWSEQAADDALLTTAALLLLEHQRKEDNNATDTDLNEAMCESPSQLLYYCLPWRVRACFLTVV